MAPCGGPGDLLNTSKLPICRDHLGELHQPGVAAEGDHPTTATWSRRPRVIMSWAAIRVSPEDPTTSSQAWAPTRSGPGLPRPHTSTSAPVVLLQVLVVVVIGERSGTLELRPNASSEGLVSCPDLCVGVSFVSYSWVPDSGNGPNVPIFTGSRGNIVLPELINWHASSVLPYGRPEHASVTRGRGKKSKDEQSWEHVHCPLIFLGMVWEKMWLIQGVFYRPPKICTKILICYKVSTPNDFSKIYIV